MNPQTIWDQAAIRAKHGTEGRRRVSGFPRVSRWAVDPAVDPAIDPEWGGATFSHSFLVYGYGLPVDELP